MSRKMTVSAMAEEHTWRDYKLNTRTRVALVMHERLRAGNFDYVDAHQVAKVLGGHVDSVKTALYALYNDGGLAKKLVDDGRRLVYSPRKRLTDLICSLNRAPAPYRKGTYREDREVEGVEPMALDITEQDSPFLEHVEDALAFLEAGRLDRVRVKLEAIKKAIMEATDA